MQRMRKRTNQTSETGTPKPKGEAAQDFGTYGNNASKKSKEKLDDKLNVSV